MNDKLEQLQNFFKIKQVPMSVKEINDIVGFIESLKTKEGRKNNMDDNDPIIEDPAEENICISCE